MGVSFGPRVLLFLFAGLLVALVPVDGEENDLSAAAVEQPDDVGSPERSVLPDGLILRQTLATGTSPQTSVEVLGVTTAADPGPVTTNTAPVSAAPQLADTSDAQPAPGGQEQTSTTTTLLSLVTEPETTTTAEPAPETTAAPTTTSPPVLSIEEQMLALVDFDWETRFPEWEVEFDGPRPSIRGLTYPGEKRIELFIRSNDTPETLLRVFTHELGHVVDVELNSNADRLRWREQRGIDDDVQWWPSAEAPDFETGAGDFAEAFAVLETGVTSRSSVGSQPTSADLQLLIELTQG